MKSATVVKNGFSLDEDMIYALMQRIYGESDAFSSSFEEKFKNREAFSRYIRQLKLAKGAVFFVAVINGNPAGYIVIAPRHQKKLQHTSDLNMGVLLSATGGGVGNALLKKALKMAAEQQIIEIIYLMVREDNAKAIALYQRHGFETLAVLHRDLKIENQYFNGLLMRLILPLP
ncbi:MAG: GNAT family N-acetyltransferase [Cyclobacteriaceae bacterium]|nr:GNAT family N-acetyltransferase [Cyclobacteriaceae bacterium]